MSSRTPSSAVSAKTVIANASDVLVGSTLKTLLSYENAKTFLFYYVVVSYVVRLERHLRARGISRAIKDVLKTCKQTIILMLLRIPSKRRAVDAALEDAAKRIEDKLVPKGPDVVRHLAIPLEGKSEEWILQEMENMDAEFSGKQSAWKKGKLSGAVYHGGDDMESIIVAAFKRYCVTNPLHPDAFPTIRKMEAEVVAMCLRMYNNPDGAGTMTCGGSESIIMAVKTYRDWARATKGITEPEMIIPESAHVAFEKAAHYFKVKIHKIPVNPSTRQVDTAWVKRAINPNTIMLVGSAVNYPDGCMDDIQNLASIAHAHKIGMHVDCCLGSFIMPFLTEAGFEVAPFDFKLPGVTSISCDTHKYGFAPKGSSVIMYRDAELRRHQYYVAAEWPGGVYGSPTIAGSRPGSLIAGTWAAMHFMGQSGYLASCKSIVTASRRIMSAIKNEIPELYVLGEPPASVVAFSSCKNTGVDILQVGDLMSARGWHLCGLMNPPGLHIAVTRLTVPVVETLIADLKDCVKEAKASPGGQGSMVVLYGVGQRSAVGPVMVERIATAFLDTMYKA